MYQSIYFIYSSCNSTQFSFAEREIAYKYNIIFSNLKRDNTTRCGRFFLSNFQFIAFFEKYDIEKNCLYYKYCYKKNHQNQCTGTKITRYYMRGCYFCQNILRIVNTFKNFPSEFVEHIKVVACHPEPPILRYPRRCPKNLYSKKKF